MAQAVPTTTQAPPAATTEAPAIVFTFEEQMTASISLYAMSLFCIIVGGIRSSRMVYKKITKGTHKIEASITMREARWFPITASVVLFGLYCFFNTDKVAVMHETASTYLPPVVNEKIKLVQDRVASWQSGSKGEPLYSKVTAYVPEHIRLPVEEFATEHLTPYYNVLPAATKANAMKAILILLSIEGCVALAALLKPLFSAILFCIPIGDWWPRKNLPYLLLLKKGNTEMDDEELEDANRKKSEHLWRLSFDTHDCVAIFFCLAVGVSHLYKRHWITNNILGIAFSIYGIENLHLSNFKAGVLLLVGLFFYDIFWVFATDVMTTVAKGIDAPILLQFPQDIYRNGWLDATKYSMLGLGDIVIPGLFIALLRRFDQRLGEMKFGQKEQKSGKDKKWRGYFAVTLIAYALGLFITMAVMHHFKRAQPALLYLVPTCVIIPLFFALLRGEVSELWNYSEEDFVDVPEEKAKKAKKEAEKKKNN